MAHKKSLRAPKFVSEDMSELMNDSQFLKDSPKHKKVQKRKSNTKPEANDDDEMSTLIGKYQASAKKHKVEVSAETPEESRQKLLDVMSHQLHTRKLENEKLLEDLSEVLQQLEADYNAMNENKQKLEHLTASYMKCIQQATGAYKQKLETLKEIHASFKQQVEGLIKHGGLKPDDRPLWFDVYRAFPPIAEPKFARPKPEIKPIRQIFFKEDVTRAEFHSKGYGTGAVNMLTTAGETQTKRLLQQYEKLKAEGVPQDELLDKSAAAVETERQEAIAARPSKIVAKNPESATAKVLAEADLKNIFKDKEN